MTRTEVATGTPGRATTSSRRGGVPGVVVAAAVAIGLVFLALPIATLVGRAVLGGSIESAVTAPVLQALTLSLATTTVSLVLTLVFGLPLAWLLARRTFRGASVIEALVDLPIVLPPSVAGLALLLAFGREGVLGRPLADAGIALPFTTAAVVLAQAFVAAPFFVRSARTGFAGVDRSVEDAARVDGASEIGVVRHVTLALARPALAAGLVMSWARSLGEFGATIMFAGNIGGRTQTLPLLVYAQFEGGALDQSIAAAAILALAAFGVLVAVRVLRWGWVIDARVAP
ncbi:MAG: ABC transporter permease [Chloroflexi bacterium]|nr:ABC transporter permease [Chloroflexota bacterium]